MPHSGVYQLRAHPTFRTQTEQLSPEEKDRLAEHLQGLRQSEQFAQGHRLHGPWSGLFDAYVFGRDDPRRLVYAVCRQCRNNRDIRRRNARRCHESGNPKECNAVPENTMMVFGIWDTHEKPSKGWVMPKWLSVR